MAQAWYSYPITQGFGKNGEKGVDLGTPFHTPITALYAGTVTWAGRTAWKCGSSGGEVVIVCNVPGRGTFSSYYLHLDTVNVKTGDKVQAGQTLGLSGGQISGGTMPVINCRNPVIVYSTGPHTEFGFNAPWVSGPGSNIDPTFSINQARAGTLLLDYTGGPPPVPTPTPTPGTNGSPTITDPTVLQATPPPLDAAIQQLAAYSAQTHRTITHLEGWESICTVLQDSEQLPQWNSLNPFGSFFSLIKPWFLRLMFALVGLVIIVFVLWEEIRTVQQSVQSVVMNSAGAAGGSGSAGTALAAAPEALAL